MDGQRHTDGEIGHAEQQVWRANGAQAPVGRGTDHAWSSAGAALAASAEPLALLTQTTDGEARHRRAATPPGPDDETPAGGLPVVEPPLWREAARYASAPPSTYEPPYPQYASPEPERATELPGRPPGPPGPPESPRSGVGLPQRVPAEPDVPLSREPDPGPGSPSEQAAGRDRWTAPELAWIADQLRRDDVPGQRPPETFDVDAVVAAVGEVPGVRAASVRTNPSGMHTLRLDLSDDADPGQVSRTVARLLLERMGLSASPQHVPQSRTSTSPERTVPEPVPGPAGAPVAPAEAPVAPAEAPLAPAEASVAPAEPEVRPLEPLRTAPAPSLAPPPTPSPPPDRWSLPAPPPAEADFDPEERFGHPLLPPEELPEPVSRPLPTSGLGAPRVVIDQVDVSTSGLEATVEVRLSAGDRQAIGVASGPAVDSYLARLAAVAAAKAIDELLRGVVEPGGQSRCFVEHTGVVSFGSTDVAVAVVLLVCGGWVEQLTGSALVDGDPRQAVVRATLGAVNRRLEALLE